MRKSLVIMAALAAVSLSSPPSTFAANSPASPRPESLNRLLTAGPHVLSDYELYYLLVGHQATGTTDEGNRVTITFNADGTASTAADSGTWRIKDGKVYFSWIPADKAWSLRTDGAGRFYSTRSNREVTIP